MPNSRIHCLLIIICTLFSSSFCLAQTSACFSNAPASFSQNSANNTPPLQAAEQTSLLKLFTALNGDWHGQTQGFFCSSSKNKPLATPDNYEINVESQLQREKRNSNVARFDLTATLESDERQSIDTQIGFTHQALMNEKIQYNIQNGILYFGLRQSNPVIVKDLRNNAVTLIESFPLRLKSGATTPRLIVRQITLLNARTIRIENYYYTRGQLFSFSRWNLRR